MARSAFVTPRRTGKPLAAAARSPVEWIGRRADARAGAGGLLGGIVRAIAACVGFVLFAAFFALAQGYDSVPDDALIVRFGESGSGYELLEAGTQGGRFITALMIATSTWNPVVALDGGSAFCTGEMHRGLVGIRPMTGVYFPELAKSWAISEDGLNITFHLREGIRWSDGAPFTADDVVFTYNDLI
ncbi:unnamed protein product, partial [marine sediment metagenome]